jgi:hypothetical protein
MKNWVINAGISLLSLVVTVSALELGARIYKGEFGVHSFLEVNRDLFRSAYPSEFDKDLGWVPKKGEHEKNVWNTTVTILEDGIRSNGKEPPADHGVRILAVGDSFTFGDQVSDDETWPALLEGMSNIRVINGGVFGYGIDQSYLRILALAAKYRPSIVVFGFIPDNVYRCELSERTSVPKPYFEPSGIDDLVLRKEHVALYDPSRSSLDVLRRILGYSFLAHKLISKAFPEYWFQGSWSNTKAHSNGAEVACRIFERVKRFAEDKQIKIYMLVQYTGAPVDDDVRTLEKTIPCIDRRVLELVDLRNPLIDLQKNDVNRFNGLFRGHMTKEGNRFVASILWEAISQQNSVRGSPK